MGRYLGPTRNEVTDLGCDLELAYNDNEALLSRGRGPGIRSLRDIYLIFNLI